MPSLTQQLLLVLDPFIEGRFLLPGNDRRPADILVPHWSNGKDAAMDVTVVMTEAATTPGFAQDYAFGNKRRTAGPKELPLANRC